MIENRWSDVAAQKFQDAAGRDLADRELALRVYSSRLIGQDPDLVMHGGGNTSVKLIRKDLFGKDVSVLHVKGSGWDLDTIDAPGLPAVRIAPLLELRKLDRLKDEDMVNIQRCNLLDSTSSNPSIETLLHAYLPHTYVDHTHSTAFMALANLPNAETVMREIFGDTMGFVPFIMPGFDLAKAAAEVYEQNPAVEGLLLAHHGHFAFGDTAKASYDKIIEQTNRVEKWLAAQGGIAKVVQSVTEAVEPLQPRDIMPLLRGMIGRANAAHFGNRDQAMPVMDLRTSEKINTFLTRSDVQSLARRGVATPDHVIRTKQFPLHLTREILTDGKAGTQKAVEAFITDYKAYFDRNAPRFGGAKTLLCPTPNVAWIEGLGLIGMGPNAKAAKIAADLAEQTIVVMANGEASGGFRPLGEADLFDMEYWSLEQAKLGKKTPPKLTGRLVLITGGAGAIGLATAKAFVALGANVFVVDQNQAALDSALTDLGAEHAGCTLDITEEGAADQALADCVTRFGGLDILVSNAGAAWTGDMAEMDQAVLRQSFELNFFAHQNFSKAAISVFESQGRGGQILFNVSKQAVNPGRGFGAYGIPKAATFFLLRQLALELGPKGIRVNGINADRIRSGLLDEDFIQQRAQARGIDEATYMSGNLLHREVEARHVAEGFISLALSERTTAHVLTVDGGNIEAALR